MLMLQHKLFWISVTRKWELFAEEEAGGQTCEDRCASEMSPAGTCLHTLFASDILFCSGMFKFCDTSVLDSSLMAIKGSAAGQRFPRQTKAAGQPQYKQLGI